MSATTAAQPARNEPPEPRVPLAGRIIWALRDPLDYLCTLERECGPIVMLRKQYSYGLFHPDLVKHVLQDNHPNYIRGERYRKTMAPLMGTGLFNSEGAVWQRQRRMAQPAFSKKNLESFAPAVLHCVETMFERWRSHCLRGEPVHLRNEYARLMLHVVLLGTFGVDAENEMDQLNEADALIHNEISLAKAFLPFRIPRWVPTPGNLRFQRGLGIFNDFAYRVITNRRKMADPGTDLLGRFVRAVDEETGGRMDDKQLRDEMMTFIHAGHDTVADALAWFTIMLARHPHIQQQLRTEIESVAGKQPLAPGAAQELPLFQRIFHETSRLYPSAWAFARVAVEPDTIGGYRIPAGAFVAVSSYVTGRSPRYWDDPERFDPDRFLPERSEGRHRFAFFPFGGGPHLCIGQGLAFLQMALILSRVLQTFDFRIEDAESIVPAPRISLRPNGPVITHLRLRN